MRTEIRCSECGRVYDGAVVADRFGGVCPRCLAGFALSPTDAGARTVIEEEPLPLKPGATFRGLEVIDVLGRGGMGVVYRARQIELGRAVALKVLSPKLAADPEFAERFQREARAMASLSHANIVHVYDFGREGEVYFLAMEFVDGVSLRSLMAEGRLETARALSIVGQICEALEYAHAQGVVHRDIKPENVLVDRAGRVRIADFGLAKVLGTKAMPTLTRTDVAMGTPQYMAPEQYESMKDVDHRADIYSLGVMFYEMLTGELPAGAFEPPSKKAAVDARLDGVVLKAMAKEPERRYQRAAHVKTDVETVSAGPAAVAADGLFERVAAALAAEKFVPVPEGKFASLGFMRVLHRKGWLDGAACAVVDAPDAVRDVAAARELRESVRREVERELGGWTGGPRVVMVIACSAELWTAVRDAGFLFRDRAGLGSTNIVGACIVNRDTGEVLRQRSAWLEGMLGTSWLETIAVAVLQWKSGRAPSRPEAARPSPRRAAWPQIALGALLGLALVTSAAVQTTRYDRAELKFHVLCGLLSVGAAAAMVVVWRAGADRRRLHLVGVCLAALLAYPILVPAMPAAAASWGAVVVVVGVAAFWAIATAVYVAGRVAAHSGAVSGKAIGVVAVMAVAAGGAAALLNAFPGPRLVPMRELAWGIAGCGVIGLVLGGWAAARRQFVAAGLAGAGAVACILGGAAMMRAHAGGWEEASKRQGLALVCATEGGRLAYMGKWAEAVAAFEEAERYGGTIDSKRCLDLAKAALALSAELAATPDGPGERGRKRREMQGRLHDLGLQCAGGEPARIEDYVIKEGRGPEGLTLATPNDWVLPGGIIDEWDLLLRLRDAVYPRGDFSLVSRAYRAVFDTGAAFVILEFPDAESLRKFGDATPGGSCSRFGLGSRLLAAVYQTRSRPWISEAFIVDWLERRPRGRAARVDDFLLDDVDLPRGVRFASPATAVSDADGIAAVVAKAGLNNVAKDEVVRAYLAEMTDEGARYALCVLATRGDAPVLRVAEAAALSSNRRAWWAHDLVAVLSCSGTPDERRHRRLRRVIEARARVATGRHLAYESDVEEAFRELPAGWTMEGAVRCVKHELTKACCAAGGALAHFDEVDEHRRDLKDARGNSARVRVFFAHSSVSVATLSTDVRKAMGTRAHERIEDGWTLIVVEGGDAGRIAEWLRRTLCLSRGAPEAVFEE